MNLSPRAAVLASSVLLGLALPAAPAAASTATPPAITATTTTTTTTPTLASRMAAVKTAKSMNYYPAAAGWSKMWTSFDAAKIDADLARIAALGATNVRAIVFPYTFGYPTPKAEYVDKLATFVRLADARGLTVKLTLFDWWGEYADVTGSTNWATALLRPYQDDPRIIAVELQNEFNPGNATAAAWAKKIVPAVRTVVPTMPLTFSVDGASGSEGMKLIKNTLAATPLDYFDFHFYGNSERSLAEIRKAQVAVAPSPMVIGETGLNTLQNTEGEQAVYLARVFEAAEIAGIESVTPWTLSDFAAGAIPETSNVSKLPAQYNYGLYRTNGTAKLAATVVRAAFTDTTLPVDLMDNSFEASAALTPWRAFMPELGMAVKTQTAARTGSWSVSLTNTGKNSAGSPSFRVAPITPVQSGQKWRGEVWARGAAATGATQIALSWFDINNRWLGGASSASLPAGTTNWTRLVVEGVAPVGAASMQIHLKSGDNKGTVWFDDVAVTAP